MTTSHSHTQISAMLTDSNHQRESRVLQGCSHLYYCTIDITVWESLPTNTSSGLLYYVHIFPSIL